MVWVYHAKNNRGSEQTTGNRMDRRMFCLNTEANMSEEPGAVVPHAGILCGVRRATDASTVTRKRPFRSNLLSLNKKDLLEVCIYSNYSI